MDNFVQPGEAVEFTAPSGGVVSGTPKLIGQILVIPCVTAAQTVRFNGYITGVFRVTKVGSQAWTEGAIVYWDAGNARFTTAGSGNFQAGIAVEAVGSGASATTGVVRLDGVGRETGT
jgi:predicted RecA/RadA family phage recombinase